jgi:hypothetical protein
MSDLLAQFFLFIQVDLNLLYYYFLILLVVSKHFYADLSLEVTSGIVQLLVFILIKWHPAYRFLSKKVQILVQQICNIFVGRPFYFSFNFTRQFES